MWRMLNGIAWNSTIQDWRDYVHTWNPMSPVILFASLIENMICSGCTSWNSFNFNLFFSRRQIKYYNLQPNFILRCILLLPI